MKKLCIICMTKPTDNHVLKMFEFELQLELANCALDGKITPYHVKRINHNTWCRVWRDQLAVDQYLEFLKELVPRYGGEIHNITVTDILQENPNGQ